MKNKLSIWVFWASLFCLLFGFSLQAHAQENYKKFDKETYEELTEDVDYTEDIKERKEPREPRNLDIEPPNLGDWSLLFDVLKALAILGLVVLLAYIVFRIFDEHHTNKKIQDFSDQVILKNLEEYIHEVNLHEFLNKALQEGNFKLAVRIHYLIIIKELSIQNFIVWKKQKTNGEYLSSLFGQAVFPLFQKSTLVFERVWYGDIEINEQTYLSAKTIFSNILDFLSKNNSNEIR